MPRKRFWSPQVLKTEAQRGAGVEELTIEILAHRDYLFSSGAIDTFLKERNERHFVDILRDSLFKRALAFMGRDNTLARVVDGMGNGNIDPYSAAEDVITGMVGKQIT